MSAKAKRRKLAGREAKGERREGFRAVGLLASRVAAPLAAKRGGGILVRLKIDWSAIVGEDWAMASWPAALARDGVLRLRTDPAAALEMQHRAPLLIERINLYLGRCVVTRLVLVQQSSPTATLRRRDAARFPAAGEPKIPDGLGDIADAELNAALGRLGRTLSANRS